MHYCGKGELNTALTCGWRNSQPTCNTAFAIFLHILTRRKVHLPLRLSTYWTSSVRIKLRH